jgi:hypothetical protein
MSGDAGVSDSPPVPIGTDWSRRAVVARIVSMSPIGTRNRRRALYRFRYRVN